MRNGVTIDYGASSFTRNAPGVRPVAVAIFVPFKGEISPVGRHECPMAQYPLAGRTTKVSDRRINVYLGGDTTMRVYWFPERGEWVGIAYSHWYESDAWGDDHNARGPFALDDYFSKKILEAFGIPEDKVPLVADEGEPLTVVLKMSPERLKALDKELTDQEPVDPEAVRSHLIDQGWLAEFIANHLGSRLEPILVAYDYYDEESNPASHRESAEYHPLMGSQLYRVSFKPARAGSPFPSWSESVDVFLLEDGSLVSITTEHTHFTSASSNYTTDVSETTKTKITPLTEAEIEETKDKIAGAMLAKVRRRSL